MNLPDNLRVTALKCGRHPHLNSPFRPTHFVISPTNAADSCFMMPVHGAGPHLFTNISGSHLAIKLTGQSFEIFAEESECDITILYED